jgi:hypothetical protein
MKKHIWVLFLFILLTLVMLYPLPQKMGNSLVDLGDSVLNTWIMSWDIHKFTTDIKGFFDANIFYPHRLTLAYSEHLVASALLVLPIWFISKNMIFSFNFIFLLSFVLCGFGTYLLVYELTKNRLAGIISGIIFAFCPFRLSRLYHLQVLTAQWIPFTFLYLLRFFKAPKWKNILLFSLFFILQALSCGYYALFLSLSVGIGFIYFLLAKRELRQIKIITKILISLLVCFLIILPFFYPYVEVKKEMGFYRTLEETKKESAYLMSYLAAPPRNMVWGRITRAFGKPEGYLFPGIIALFLSIFGLTRAPKKVILKGKPYLKIDLVLLGFLIVYTALYFLTGIGRASLLTRTAVVFPFFALIVIRISIDRRVHALGTHQGFFLLLSLLAIILSLGPIIYFGNKSFSYGPYHLLYWLIPGFDGIRVVSRFGMITMLGIGVLAGYGVTRLMKRINKKALLLIIPLLILVEYFSSVPINATRRPDVEVNLNNPPQVYRWLADQEGDFAVLELPSPNHWYDYMYMYYSTFHWKDLVNGHSGYVPPEYRSLRQLFKKFPSKQSVRFFKRLGLRRVHMKHEDGSSIMIKSKSQATSGVKYIVFHTAHYKPEKWKKKEIKLRDYSSLQLKKKFGSDYVYEFIR